MWEQVGGSADFGNFGNVGNGNSTNRKTKREDACRNTYTNNNKHEGTQQLYTYGPWVQWT